MINFHFNCFCLLTLSLLIAQEGLCLVCYECTEATNPDCANRIKSIQGVPCRQPSDVCVIHKTPPAVLNVEEFTANMTVKLIRGCKFKDYCDYVKDFSAQCFTCTTDLCNVAYKILASVVLVPFCILFVNLL